MTQENESKELIPISQEMETFEDSLTLAIKRTDLFEKVRSMALGATNIKDWIDQNGQPYLQGSGAEKVMRRFGLRVWDLKMEKIAVNDEKGDYYYFRYTAKFGFNEYECIESVGTCSSRDQFFAIRNGKLLPQSEVDITNIEKSAYTNCINNGAQRFLGIRGITWEELKQYGVTPDQVQKVSYAKGKKSDQWTPEVDKVANRIGNFLLASADGDKMIAGKQLETLTKWTDKNKKEVPGKTSLKNLSAKQIEILFKKLEKEIIEFEKPSEVKDGSTDNQPENK